MAIEQDAPPDDTAEKDAALEAQIDPKNDYSGFLGDVHQTIHPPEGAQQAKPKASSTVEQAASRSPAPPASPKPKEAKEPEKPKLSDDLVDLAKNLGFEDDELERFEGDNKALTKTIAHLLRNHRGPEDDDEEDDDDDLPKSKKAKDEAFDWEKFEKGQYSDETAAAEGYDGPYDHGVVKLARHVKTLEARLEKLAEFEKLLPAIENDIRQRHQERARAVWEADLKEAGIDPAPILGDDKALAKGVNLIQNLINAYKQQGVQPPKASELWKAVLPLVGVAGSSPPQADDRPTGQSKGGELSAAQKAAIDRTRNPMNGQFVAEPAHRGGGNGKGDPLRSFLLDNSIDPGAPPAEMSKESFLP